MARIIIILLIFISCIKTYADEMSYFPVMGSLTTSLSLPANSKNINTSFSVGILHAQYHNLYGLGIASLYQESLGDMYGLQASFANLANNIQYGAQAGVYNKVKNGNLVWQLGLINSANKMDGIQAGYVNLADYVDGTQVGLVSIVDRVDGAQVGLVNVADIVDGLQLGLVNTTTDVNGVQLGVVNYADNEEGTSIGLISFVRNGTFRISSLYSSQNEPSIQTELGGKKIYNILRYSYSTDSKRLEYWIGFGANLNLYEKKFYFYPQAFTAGPMSAQSGFGLTAKFGYLFSEYFEAISGINLNINNDVHNSSAGFLHRDMYNAAFFLGMQVDFKQSLSNLFFGPHGHPQGDKF